MAVLFTATHKGSFAGGAVRNWPRASARCATAAASATRFISDKGSSFTGARCAILGLSPSPPSARGHLGVGFEPVGGLSVAFLDRDPVGEKAAIPPDRIFDGVTGEFL